MSPGLQQILVLRLVKVNLRHNLYVRRLLAACLLALFAALATTDALACSDGCRSNDCMSTTDRCAGPTGCIFCTGSVIVVPTHVFVAPVIGVVQAPVFSINAPLVITRAVPDHPPRLT